MAEIAMMGILFLAVYFDCKTQKIPNLLVLSGLIPAAIAFRQIGDMQGMFLRFLCVVFVFILCWCLYAAGGLGAGDVKLFLVLTAVCGIFRFVYIVLTAFVLAAAYSIVKILRAGETLSWRFYFNKLMSKCCTKDDTITPDRGHKVILTPFLAIAYILVMAERRWM